jgi:pimeloyl-ACP methyl ester carboxylesterase
MSSTPETRYAKSGDTYIAYQVMGNGPFDLVLVPGLISHLEMQLELPIYASFMAALASFCRLIRFDKRGTGLSDRLKAIPTQRSGWTMSAPSWMRLVQREQHSLASLRVGQ